MVVKYNQHLLQETMAVKQLSIFRIAIIKNCLVITKLWLLRCGCLING